jgi:hypothetical protein
MRLLQRVVPQITAGSESSSEWGRHAGGRERCEELDFVQSLCILGDIEASTGPQRAAGSRKL